MHWVSLNVNMTLLDLDCLPSFRRIFLCCYVIILIDVTRLVPHLLEFFIAIVTHGPYALPKPLVTFSVLFDSLLDLPFVRPCHPVRFRCCILGWGVFKLAVRIYR